jgi:hypothetical protein
MASRKREKAWSIGFHLGKEIGLPKEGKMLVTGAGAGMTIGGLVANDDPLLIVGLITAFIGITA